MTWDTLVNLIGGCSKYRANMASQFGCEKHPNWLVAIDGEDTNTMPSTLPISRQGTSAIQALWWMSRINLVVEVFGVIVKLTILPSCNIGKTLGLLKADREIRQDWRYPVVRTNRAISTVSTVG